MALQYGTVNAVFRSTLIVLWTQYAIGALDAQEEVQRSPFDLIEPTSIPMQERFDSQPSELVAVIGSHRAKASGRIALHPEGRLLASGEFRGGVGAVTLWNQFTLRPVAKLRGHSQYVTDVAFSADGKMLASASADTTVRIWGVAQSDAEGRSASLAELGLSVSERWILRGHRHKVHSVTFSHDSKMLASGDVFGHVLLWDVTGATPDLIARLPASFRHQSGKPLAVAFSPDSKILAVGFWFDVVLWDTTTEPPAKLKTLEPKTGPLSRKPDDYPSVVESIAFSPDGKTLAAGHYNSGGVRLWDITGDLQREVTWLDARTTRTVMFAPDGQTLYSGGTPLGLVWSIAERKLQARFTARWGIVVSGDGQTMITTHSDGVIRRWDLSGANPKEIRPLVPHDEEVRQFAISADGRTLVTTASDDSIRLWDVGKQLKPRATFVADSDLDTQIALTPDGERLVVGNSRGLQLWNVADGRPQLVRRLSPPTNDRVWSMVVLPNGRLLATGGRYPPRLHIWDITDVGSAAPIAVRNESTLTMSRSPDGRFLATGHADKETVKVWNLSDPIAPKIQCEIKRGPQTAFSPRSQSIAVGGRDGIVRIRNFGASTPRQQSAIEVQKGAVHSIAFSPSGKRIVVSYAEGYVLLTDVAGRKLIDWQLDHAAELRFTPDGRHLLTKNGNSTAYVLRLPERIWERN